MRPFPTIPLLAIALLTSLAASGSVELPGVPASNREDGASAAHAARAERVEDFRVFAAGPRTADPSAVRLERVTTAVPWPRGLVVVEGELITLARGRHRNAGGVDPSVADRSGTLFTVDPDVFEAVIRSEEAGREVRENARSFATPTGPPFFFYDPQEGPPIEDTRMDRPYCTLAFDPESENYFICGYSGVDLPQKRFRKNASDSIHRYDARTGEWHVVEIHDATVVPEDRLGYVVPNEYYPHHDPATATAPHGWLNGPDGACIAGRYLYAVGKDNHTIARYDLAQIRRDPDAGPPPSELVFSGTADVRLGGEVRRIVALGPSALAAHDGYLYVGYRTSSTVFRFPLENDGSLVEPKIGELIAVFEPWSPEENRSANLIDLTFDSKGRLFVSCAQEGRIWNVGVPDPESVFDGVDHAQ
ncbi:MAG: hypothetical protein O7B99_12080, partial [Planctomycetota bacterium]|nr:hypothetical protein [Planctomycetota bacterium]